MRGIPDPEISVLRAYESQLKRYADDAIEGEGTRDQLLAVLAVNLVSRVVRQMNDRSVNKRSPDVIVAAPAAAWLGQGVSQARGIDLMVLGSNEDGEITPCEGPLSELYADRQRLAIIGTVIGEGTDMAGALRLPDIKKRALVAIALIDELGPRSEELGIRVCSVIKAMH